MRPTVTLHGAESNGLADVPMRVLVVLNVVLLGGLLAAVYPGLATAAGLGAVLAHTAHRVR